jgi:hypothetical protein
MINLRAIPQAVRVSLFGAAFFLLLLVSFGAVVYLEQMSIPEPIQVSLTSVKTEPGNILVLGVKIKNQTDSIIKVPEINAAIISSNRKKESILFYPSTPLLIGGEEVEFEQRIEYNAGRPHSITLTLPKE